MLRTLCSENYEIQKRCISDLTINNHNTLNAIVKFFSSVKLDTFAKSPDIASDIIFQFTDYSFIFIPINVINLRFQV